MRARIMLLVLAVAALASTAIATTAATATAAPRAAAATVSVRTTKLGRVLVDAQGRTLYLFLKDKPGRSACAGACAKAWPPLMTAAKPKVSGGAEARLLGTTHRASGTQVTYAGHPLYLFEGDTKAGQTTGQGSTSFGAPWYVMATSGREIVKR